MNTIKKVLFFIACTLPLLAIVSIWLPIYFAFHVFDPTITEKELAESMEYPALSTVNSIGNIQYKDLYFSPNMLNDIEKIAEEALVGKINVEGLEPQYITMPFDADAQYIDDSEWQQAYSSFLIPKIFVHAYEKTLDEKYLEAALKFILGWDRFEKDVWGPSGFILNSNVLKGRFVWNDHAVSTRIDVLANFWHLYRHSSIFTEQHAIKIFQLVLRDADFLSRDINYTFATNHGTMQNLALLKVALYFPKLPRANQYKNIAINKLNEQFKYLINDEGIILEHSSEYHMYGLHLVSIAIKMSNLLKIDLSKEIIEKYRNGIEFSKHLHRPDRSLPKLGDTKKGADKWMLNLIDLNKLSNNTLTTIDFWKPHKEQWISPVAGYDLWWSGLDDWPDEKHLTQTAITWSNYPGMGHKHADELSFNIWKGGQEWWSNVGYWPYDNYRVNAVSWAGSNAPHYKNEDSKSKRESKVNYRYEDKLLKVLDLERLNEDGFRTRRQLLQLGDSIWLTLDSFYGEHADFQVVWGLNESLNIKKISDKNDFEVFSEEQPLTMSISFTGEEGMVVDELRGSIIPRGGWGASKPDTYPANAFIVKQNKKNSWLASVSIIDTSSKKHNNIVSQYWISDENWSYKIFLNNQSITVTRFGGKITITDSNNYLTQEVTLSSIPSVIHSKKSITTSYEIAKSKYGDRFIPLAKYRKKMSFAVFILFVVNLCVLIMMRKKGGVLPLLSICSFSSLIVWLVNIYFVV